MSEKASGLQLRNLGAISRNNFLPQQTEASSYDFSLEESYEEPSPSPRSVQNIIRARVATVSTGPMQRVDQFNEFLPSDVERVLVTAQELAKLHVRDAKTVYTAAMPFTLPFESSRYYSYSLAGQCADPSVEFDQAVRVFVQSANQETFEEWVAPRALPRGPSLSEPFVVNFGVHCIAVFNTHLQASLLKSVVERTAVHERRMDAIMSAYRDALHTMLPLTVTHSVVRLESYSLPQM